MIQPIVRFMLDEDWEFTLECVDSEPATLVVPMFNGKLTLLSNETWSFKED